MSCKTFRYLKIFLITTIFFACDKDEISNNNSTTNSTTNNATSQNCGTVTVNVVHTTNETFSSNVYDIRCDSPNNRFVRYNGVPNRLVLDFDLICLPSSNLSNNTSPILEIQFWHDYYDCGFNFGDYQKNQCGGNSFYSKIYHNSNSNDSIIMNISVDEINYNISGDFTLFDLTGSSPTVNVIFDDFPVAVENIN
tara:strand:+ start:128 stop:712 length:585 start_codon:yes stop_codon:yes gene_type:complete